MTQKFVGPIANAQKSARVSNRTLTLLSNPALDRLLERGTLVSAWRDAVTQEGS